MKLPKYKFYVGDVQPVALSEGFTRDLTTGDPVDADGYYTTVAPYPLDQYEEGLPYVFLNIYTSVETGTYILWYDERGEDGYMGYYNLPDYIKDNRVIAPPDGAKYYALVFDKDDEMAILRRETDFMFFMRECTPRYKDLKKKYKHEDNHLFLRTELSGDVTLSGRDFDYIWNSELESLFIFMIQKLDRSTGEYNLYYKGRFAKTDCEMDFSLHTCTPDFETLDDYTDVLDKYDNTYDIVKLGTAVNDVSLHFRSTIQIYVGDSSKVTNVYGNMYYTTDITGDAQTDRDTILQYNFAAIKQYVELEVADTDSKAAPDYLKGIYAGQNNAWYTGNRDYYLKIDELQYVYGGWGCRVSIYNSAGVRVAYGYPAAGAMTTDWDDEYILLPGYSDFLLAGGSEIVYDGYASVIPESDAIAKVTNVFKYDVYMRILTNADNFAGTATVDLRSDDFVVSGSNYKKTLGYQYSGFQITGYATDDATQYGKNDFGQYFTNRFPGSLFPTYRGIPIDRNIWGNASLWFFPSPEFNTQEAISSETFVLEDAHGIADVVKTLLSQIAPYLKHEATEEYSQFLYGDTQPLSLLSRFYVFVTQKSNVLAGDYDQAAQTAETTMEDVMGMLERCFKCYWYIEDGKFKIEHVHYFNNGRSYVSPPGSQLDLTQKTDQFNKKPALYFQSEVEYDKDDLAKRYEFSWGDEVSELFSTFTVDIASKFVAQDNTESVSESNFTSDIDLMLLSPDDFQEDGFALICATRNADGSYEVPLSRVTGLLDENGDGYEAYVQNWYASWPYLLRAYAYDFPVANAGLVTTNLVTGDNIFLAYNKKCMTHEVEFPCEEDPDEIQTITTDLGDGVIDTMEINIDTRVAKVTLKYYPK